MGKRVPILLALMLLIGAAASTASIDLSLQQEMNSMEPGETVQALVYLANQADIPALNQQLKAEHATLAERNQRVIMALQEAATQSQPEMAAFLEELKAQDKIRDYKMFWIANMFWVEAEAEGINAIAARQDVSEVFYNYGIENIEPIKKVRDQSIIASHEIGLDRINAPAVWAQGWTGQGRVLMNIDTGVEGTHPALSARFRGDVDGDGDFSESWFDPYDTHYPTPTDGNGHGTHTMGTICGRTASGDTIGVAINAQWIAAAAIDRGGGIPRTVSDAILSFQWAVDPDGNPNTQDNPDAIGNSWGVTTSHGYPPCDQTFWTVIDNCEAAGSVVIFSAGNEGTSGLRRPADRGTTPYNCFAVGAVDGNNPSLPIAYFSSQGPTYCGPNGEMVIKPEVVAPGVDIRSAWPGGGYNTIGGTSMASPHVTGAVGILRQVNPNLDADAIKEILLSTATDLGTTGDDNVYGKGNINLLLAVQIAMTGFGYVDGYIRNSTDNSPIPANVSVVGGFNQVTANSSGYYFMGLPADTTYTLRASYFGFIPTTYSVPIVANDTTAQNFLLSPAPSAILQGYVRDTANVAIPNAMVTIIGTPLAPATTNSMGFYQFPAVPTGSTYQVSATAANFSVDQDSIYIASGTNSLDFTLFPVESFEYSNGQYVGSGVWEWGEPTSGPGAAHSGVKCWGTVLGGNYPDNANDPLYSRDFSIISPSAAMEFYHWYSTEGYYDGGNVSISTNGGGTWTLITPTTGYPEDDCYALGEAGFSATSSGWEHVTFDIGSYLGQTVKFRFRFASDGSVVGPGWYIDDVAVSGSGTPEPPNITYSPNSYNVSAAPGQVETRPLNINNTGAGYLSYFLSTQTYNLLLDNGQRIPVKINADLEPIGTVPASDKPDAADEPLYPPMILSQGGPDIFGHSWIDSDESGGPVFSWVDISGSGTAVPLTDDSYAGPFAMGFAFPYFENSYTELYIGSNGLVSFGAGTGSLGNTTIPNSELPNDILPIFWDDLNPGSGGVVRYFQDTANNRFIVSYDGVPHYSNYGALYFQVILNGNGSIVYQYGSMDDGGHGNNAASIGIENAAGTDGLQVAFNQDYVHSNLAIKFSAGWLFAAPSSGNLAPGGNASATITFDASNLNIGTYTGNINLDSNDPETPNIDIPITFNVGTGGTPNIVLTPVSFADTLIAGDSSTFNLKVKNTGDGTLAVTFSDSATWIDVAHGPVFVSPGDSVFQIVRLNAFGLVPATYSSRVVSTSNDPDTPNIITNVTLYIPSPNIGVTPAAIRDTLAPGSSATHYLTVSNTGQGILSYSAATNISNLALDDGRILPVSIKPVIEQPFAIINHPLSETKPLTESGPANPPMLLSQGGPDIFGHRWIDSNEPGGPTYNWVDITGFGTPITGLGDDTNVGPFPTGFNVNFYGTTYNSFHFCTNGYITFTSTAAYYNNLSLPSLDAPFDLLAALWDDLDFSTGGTAYYYTNNVDSLVVSWIDAPHYSVGGPYTFQIIVLSNGSIFYQYQAINSPDDSNTIGIQNFDGTDGLQVAYNALYVQPYMAIKFSAGWLSASPSSGNVNPGSQAQIAVTLDATNLSAGTHSGNVVISSNDPDTPVITVPVTLLVEGMAAPDIEIPVSSIADTLNPGNQVIVNLVVRNRGGADLLANFAAAELSLIASEGDIKQSGKNSGAVMSSIKQDDPPTPANIWLFISPEAGTIGAGDSLIAQVTLNSGSIAPGTHTGHVTITSNDPDEATVNIPVTLFVQAAGEPEINPSVVSFDETIPTGGSLIRELYLENAGGAMLYYGLHDNRAWITVVPDTGFVPAAVRDTIVVTFNASALSPGTYTGQINLNSNDPDEGLLVMPVTLLVTGGGGDDCVYIPGDMNGNGVTNGIDVGYGVNYFKGGPVPPIQCDMCPQPVPFYAGGDVNGNCVFNGIDVTFFVNYLKGIVPSLLYCPTCPPSLIPAAVNPVENTSAE